MTAPISLLPEPLADKIRSHPRHYWEPERPRVHYLIAPAGVPNWGDELIVSSWLRFLSHACPHDTVVVDCHSPGKAGVLFRQLHPNLVLTDTVWNLVEQVTNDILGTHQTIPQPADVTAEDLDRMMLHTRTVVSNPGAMADYATNIHLLNNADTIHIVGGGYLNDMWPHHCAVVSAARAAVRRPRRAPEPQPLFIATGQGIIPQRQGKIVEELLAADFITVRDKESHEFLQKKIDVIASRKSLADAVVPELALATDDSWLALAVSAVEEQRHRDHQQAHAGFGRIVQGVRRRMNAAIHGCPRETPRSLSPDLATWLSTIAEAQGDVTVTPVVQTRFPYTTPPAGRRVVLCVQSDLVSDKDVLWQWVHKVLRAWQVTGPELVVVEAIPYGDYEVWRNVVETGFPGAEFIPFDQLWAQGLPVGEGVRWLSTRFHPHLLASAAGCAGLALDVNKDGYYRVKHQSVLDAGSQWEVLDINAEGDDTPADAADESATSAFEIPSPTHSFDVSRCETNMWTALQLAEALYAPSPTED
ncbi:MAG: polysaccharide pyruvyl transferase family protein [Lawsonella sp.]